METVAHHGEHGLPDGSRGQFGPGDTLRPRNRPATARLRRGTLVPDAPNLAMLEQPAAFTDALEGFLADTLSD